MRPRALGAALILGSLLAACSSTAPAATAPPASRAAASVAPAASAPPDGPITASMAQLQLGGERYSALGDPKAPLTLVEFSDYG